MKFLELIEKFINPLSLAIMRNFNDLLLESDKRVLLHTQIGFWQVFEVLFLIADLLIYSCRDILLLGYEVGERRCRWKKY